MHSLLNIIPCQSVEVAEKFVMPASALLWRGTMPSWSYELKKNRFYSITALYKIVSNWLRINLLC
jgi:hypothetical protein